MFMIFRTRHYIIGIARKSATDHRRPITDQHRDANTLRYSCANKKLLVSDKDF